MKTCQRIFMKGAAWMQVYWIKVLGECFMELREYEDTRGLQQKPHQRRRRQESESTDQENSAVEMNTAAAGTQSAEEMKESSTTKSVCTARVKKADTDRQTVSIWTMSAAEDQKAAKAVPDNEKVPEETGRYIPLHNRALVDDSATQRLESPSVGHACRDCLNSFFDIHLDSKDCKYERGADGHRERGKCMYCEKTKPIVVGLTIVGRIKMLGKK